MDFSKYLWRKKRGNTIDDVKSRLLSSFSIIAFTTSFCVFFAFSLRLVFKEDSQIQSHLISFKDIAIKYYQLDQKSEASLSQQVTAYYDVNALTDSVKSQLPYALEQVSSFRSFQEEGFMVYHTVFDYQGKRIPLYLTVDSRAIEFGDESWDVLMGTSMLLMLFLIIVLRFSLKRVFDGLMSPISDLSEQLKFPHDRDFSVSDLAIDEVQALTQHLNGYAQMKARLVKQELMFAKYASHELKTPISVVLGAANLQAMKADVEFQVKQRERIIRAASGMQQTVELLLSIVKQENRAQENTQYALAEDDLDLSLFVSQLSSEVTLQWRVMDNTYINFPKSALDIVLKNLIDNAIRFTQQGSIDVEICSNRIVVIDSGCGLAISGTNKTEHGLGLLIVDRLSNSYGWQFSIVDNPDHQGCLAMLERSSD